MEHLRQRCLPIGLLMSLLSAMLAGACGQPPAQAPAADPAALRAELLQADKDFSALAFEQGVENAYARFIAANAVQLPDGGLPLMGKEAIVNNVAESLGDVEFSLSWEPADARVSASGDLGYTWGYYYVETASPDGQLESFDGKYANVWHRGANGWEVLLDISNQNEPPFLDELEFDALLDDEQNTLP